jgi:hypothetical protein
MLPMMGGQVAGPPGLLQPAAMAPGGQVAMVQPGMAHRQGAALVAQQQVVVPGQVAPVQLAPVQPQVLLVPPPAQHQFQQQLRQGGPGGVVMQPMMPMQASARPVGMPMTYAPTGGGPQGGGLSMQPDAAPTLFFDPVSGMYYQQQYQQ